VRRAIKSEGVRAVLIQDTSTPGAEPIKWKENVLASKTEVLATLEVYNVRIIRLYDSVFARCQTTDIVTCMTVAYR